MTWFAGLLWAALAVALAFLVLPVVAIFVDVGPGDLFTRPSAGGGGFGDPLERDPEAVVEDVADGYVTIERACVD